MRRTSLFFALLLLLPRVEPCFAKFDIDVGGRANLEFDTHDRFRETEFNKELVLDVETERRSGVKAVADIRMTVESRNVRLRELYLDYKNDAGNKFILGQAKKEFGLGWEFGMERRLALTRGLIYRKLGDLSYVGRDSTGAYRVGGKEPGDFTHTFSLHSSEGLNAAALYQLKRWLDEKSFWTTYTLLQTNQLSDSWSTSWAQAVSFAAIRGAFRIEAELFFGKDYIETDYQSRRGDPRTVYFSALSFGGAWQKHELQPYFRGAMILHDLSDLGSHSFELTLGSRYYFHPRFYLGGEVVFVRSNEQGGSATGFDSTSQALFVLRYFF